MAGLKRGQFIVAATPGDFGKPRPSLIIQNDLFAGLSSVLVCPLTTASRADADEFRIGVTPTRMNGLREASFVAVDKTTVLSVRKVGSVIGEADSALLLRVSRALALFAGIV